MIGVDQSGGPSLETLTAPPYAKPSTDLVAETEKLLIISFLLGRDHAARPLDLADQYDPVPFEEAITFMKARVPLTKAEWNDLEPKLRFRAFTVAALSAPDAIEKVRRTVLSAIEEGKPLSEFWTETMAEDAAQLSGKNPGYWENVYRTNTQTAYNAGRAAEFMATNPEYLEFIGIEDTRQTEICADRSGVILPATHPFWSTNWPPLHFQCRSTPRGIYREEADLLRERNPDWGPTADGDIEGILGAAKGFGGNPIETGSFWRLTPQMIERAKEYGLFGDIKAYAKELGIKRFMLKGAPRAAKATAGAAVDIVPTFKSVKEAERWIVENNLADAASFKGCDLRFVQEWTIALRSIVGEYPKARTALQFVGTCQERTRRLAGIIEEQLYQKLTAKGVDPGQARAWAKRTAKEGAAKWRTPSTHIAEFCTYDGIVGISVNEKYAKSYELFQKIRERNVAAGWKPIGTGKVIGTLEHEMGHLLDHVYGLSNSTELESYHRTLTREEIVAGLSGYANQNKQELIAEAWSEYRLSSSPRAISRKVAELMLARIRKTK